MHILKYIVIAAAIKWEEAKRLINEHKKIFIIYNRLVSVEIHFTFS